jgi:acetolactate synthase I/II/III large subunit
VIAVENAAPDPEAFAALVALAETAAIPVVEGQGAFFGNFPKSHDLYLGGKIEPFYGKTDLVLLVENRAPWYPPSNAPPGAEIVAISENPIKGHMVYQVTHAGTYLEGDVGTTLRLLAHALDKVGFDKTTIASRRAQWAAEHRKWQSGLREAEDKATAMDTITTPLLVKALREVMPADAAYVDETIVHSAAIREHLEWNDSTTFFRAPSGLGQGIGYALGVKLAFPKRPVVMTIGDGTYMYNPVIPALAFADEHGLPLLIVVVNNAKYAAMQFFHDRFYPEGASITTKDYYGVNIKAPKYEEAAKMVGGYAATVKEPTALKGVLEEALRCVQGGKCAIVNVDMPSAARLR